MVLIPIGLIFILYSTSIPVGGISLDLLPDVVGYVLIAVNLWRLKRDSYSFTTAFPLSLFLAVYSVAVRLIAPGGLFGLIASGLELGLQVWLLKLLVDGVEDLEDLVDRHLNSILLGRWQQLTCMAWLASFVCLIAQSFIPGVEFFGFLVAVIFMVLGALLTITFFRTARRYSWLIRFGDGGETAEEEDAVEDGENKEEG